MSLQTFFAGLETDALNFLDTFASSEFNALVPILTSTVANIDQAVIANATTPSGIGEAVSQVLKGSEISIVAAGITAGASSLLTAVGSVLATAQSATAPAATS